MRKILIIAIILFLVSCTKEHGITTIFSNIKNSSAHQIKITFYYSGITYPDKILLLNPGDSVKFGFGYEYGILNQGGGLSSDYFGSANDSIVVSFDNLYSITHYVNTPVSLNSKHYLYSSLRNLANYLSWEYWYHDSSKDARQEYFLYRFSEQDYLDAK